MAHRQDDKDAMVMKFLGVALLICLGGMVALMLQPSCAAADELHLTDRTGSTVYKTARSWGGGTVIRDSSGRTVARISRQFGSKNLVIRNTSGRTLLTIKRGRYGRGR